MYKNKKVFIAMSGGVDSSVAACLLEDAGYDVEGVTMCFSIHYPNQKRPSCCGTEGIVDARNVCKRLGIVHHVIDFAKDIDELIIKNFIDEYTSGRTPNPCVRCNEFLKFGTLLDFTKKAGVDFLATGHYSKILFNTNLNRFELYKAKDFSKDQSYFLYGLNKKDLKHVLFPLGDLSKPEVRKIAKKFGLDTADKKESQDICFVPETGYKQFIKERINGSMFSDGDFINHEGKVVGRHKGLFNYTIGQRDKLGIALGYPAYVYKIDKKKNQIFVGPKECLFSKGLIAKDVNFVSIDYPKNDLQIYARIRYNAKEIQATLKLITKNKVEIIFKEPQKAVTPGQSVVFYDDDLVLGGAIIDEAIV